MAVMAFTDYPLYPEEYGKPAPIREVEFVSYDGNKYVKVKYQNQLFEFKAGYLYLVYGRCGEVPRFNVNRFSPNSNVLK